MRAVVVYESMYGNTRAIAEAIGEGLGSEASVIVTPVAQVSAEQLAGVDLLVVGGPTHAWGMSRPGTRKGAVAATQKPDSGLVLEPGAEGPGLREWFESLGRMPAKAAAFDTRYKVPPAFGGRAARGIGRRLRQHGFELASNPESFFVTKRNELIAGEDARARTWGGLLASASRPA